ncbi:MAG: M56 family metallopeptidase [Ruminococcus sp.]|nr:M56 family metallopeptidase [Ruminococcus sp.]
MPSEIFYWILNMSISASITGVIILIVSKIRRLPRRIVSFLWCIPLLRMWLPIAINSKYSLMTLISKITTKTVTVYSGLADFSMTNHIMAADTYFPITYKVDMMEDIFSIAFIVWAVIAAMLIMTLFAVYVITKADLKNSRHLRDNIYISDKITSPAVYGIICVKIVLPNRYKNGDLKYILMHEQAHIKRKDNLWRFIAILTVCIHWFNPFSWLFLKRFLENIELACDEIVLKLCGEEEKKKYANALLNCAENKIIHISAFGGASTRIRIERILSYKNLSRLSIISFVVLSIVIGCILITNAT